MEHRECMGGYPERKGRHKHLEEEADAAYDTDGTVLAPRKSKYTFNATPQEYPNGDE